MSAIYTSVIKYNIIHLCAVYCIIFILKNKPSQISTYNPQVSMNVLYIDMTIYWSMGFFMVSLSTYSLNFVCLCFCKIYIQLSWVVHVGVYIINYDMEVSYMYMYIQYTQRLSIIIALSIILVCVLFYCA